MSIKPKVPYMAIFQQTFAGPVSHSVSRIVQTYWMWRWCTIYVRYSCLALAFRKWTFVCHLYYYYFLLLYCIMMYIDRKLPSHFIMSMYRNWYMKWMSYVFRRQCKSSEVLTTSAKAHKMANCMIWTSLRKRRMVTWLRSSIVRCRRILARCFLLSVKTKGNI